MKDQGERLWTPIQKNKMSFEPGMAEVLEERHGRIPVAVERTRIAIRKSGPETVTETVVEILDESELFATEADCRARCIELLEARRAAFESQHKSRMSTVDANLEALRSADDE